MGWAMNATIFEPKSIDGDTSYERIVGLMHRLVDVWADHIKSMPPRHAQKFIGENVDRLRDEIAPTCGAEFATSLVNGIERAVWQNYDQSNQPRAIA